MPKVKKIVVKRTKNSHKGNPQQTLKIAKLYPKDIGSADVVSYIKIGLDALKKKNQNGSNSWVGSRVDQEQYNDLLGYFGDLQEEGLDPKIVIKELVAKLFDGGIPNWRDPGTMYNICTPVNVVSNAIECIANELNIHNISTDFAGAAAVSEKAVNKIFSKIIGSEDLLSFFTFSGTGTNMYAFKIALNNYDKGVSLSGLKGNEYFAVTEQSHFSHKSIADWLGIGLNKLITIKADKNGRSIAGDFEEKASEVIENGGILVGIILNGGPFYNFAVDPIADFVAVRKKLMDKYDLKYSPHIHVDSVITWVWLLFKGYDFKLNPLGFSKKVSDVLKDQYSRIKDVRLADSFGVDFHKAFGGCPATCSMFCLNDGEKISTISKSGRGIDTHHLGNAWSLNDMSDITLETTRSASAPLAALAMLKTLGLNGMRQYIANQMAITLYLRDTKAPGFVVANREALGFNTMLLVIPLAYRDSVKNYEDFLEKANSDPNFLIDANGLVNNLYQKSLEVSRLGCSFSKSFAVTADGRKISGLKYTIVSPHASNRFIDKELVILGKILQIVE